VQTLILLFNTIMNTDLPKVSIITICLNSGKCMENTIRNVRSQTYANIEYVVIDGGSRDNTQDTVKKQIPIDQGLSGTGYSI